jgi:hypothetical protein
VYPRRHSQAVGALLAAPQLATMSTASPTRLCLSQRPLRPSRKSSLSSFSDFPLPFLRALGVNSFAFISVHLRSSLVPLTFPNLATTPLQNPPVLKYDGTA